MIDIHDGCIDDGIRVVDVRHEQTATHAADDDARRIGFSRVCRDLRAAHDLNGSIRARSSSVPARPYIDRFSVFSRLIWPSV
jgi:thiamine pyrophosphate-dependent acetolactate synthase large subunit-like protein